MIEIKTFLMYLTRWECSTPIYAGVIGYLSIQYGFFWSTVIANFVGACVFYYPDKWIFKKKNIRKKIFVCSKLKGDIRKNTYKTRKYCRYVMKQGHIPIAPHIYFTQFLNDKALDERSMGIYAGLELLEICDEMWVFGDKITEGMKQEINAWNKKTIRYIKEVD